MDTPLNKAVMDGEECRNCGKEIIPAEDGPTVCAGCAQQIFTTRRTP